MTATVRPGWSEVTRDVELREAEDEPLAPIDQDQNELVSQRLAQAGRQLETAETRPQHDD